MLDGTDLAHNDRGSLALTAIPDFLLIPPRIRAIFVKAGTSGEAAEPQALVQPDRSGIALTHFEAQRCAIAFLRSALDGCQQGFAEPAAARGIGYRDRVQARDNAIPAKENDGVAEQTGFIDRGEYRGCRTMQMLAVLRSRQVIGRERALLQRDQAIQIGGRGAADAECGTHGQASLEDARRRRNGELRLNHSVLNQSDASATRLCHTIADHNIAPDPTPMPEPPSMSAVSRSGLIRHE
jgi:hypothetical protein